MARKILFAGTPDIAVPALESLARDKNIEVVGVMCPPDKKVGRKQIITPCAVKKSASALGLKVFHVEKKSDVVVVYEELKPELVVVIALGVIFPEEALKISPTVNVHFSLLPKWRGASPVQSAILQGDKVSGITLQKMVRELDAGDILWQKEEEIGERSTRQLWHDWAEMTANHLPALAKDFEILEAVPQDASLATKCGKFKKSDGEIHPKDETAEMVIKKYRAFDVWPGIFVKTSLGNVKIIECSKDKDDNSVELKCKKGSIWLQKIQIPGKSVAIAKDVVNGNQEVFRNLL